MVKRKQEPIFSRLKEMQPESPPEKQQVEDLAHERDVTVPTPIAEHRVYYQSEPVETEEKLVISGETPSRTDPLASFDSSFVFLAPGTFLMGSPEYENGRSSDEIMHEVTLTKGFYMQKTPLTQGQWKAVMDNNPASFSDGGDD